MKANKLLNEWFIRNEQTREQTNKQTNKSKAEKKYDEPYQQSLYCDKEIWNSIFPLFSECYDKTYNIYSLICQSKLTIIVILCCIYPGLLEWDGWKWQSAT